MRKRKPKAILIVRKQKMIDKEQRGRGGRAGRSFELARMNSMKLMTRITITDSAWFVPSHAAFARG